jgi:hypothetical protein
VVFIVPAESEYGSTTKSTKRRSNRSVSWKAMMKKLLRIKVQARNLLDQIQRISDFEFISNDRFELLIISIKALIT